MQLKQIILISTLAEYQTKFWLAVAKDLRHRGQECAFLSFDDRSSEALSSEGFRVYSLPVNTDSIDVSDAAIDEATAKYGISDLNSWFTHERVTFAIRDERVLRRKLLAALQLGDQACADLLTSGKRVVMVQEVGGFLSVIGSYFAARKHGVDNWFIEPAFFRGRMFFLRNSFAAPEISKTLPDAVTPAVSEYLANARRTGNIVIPLKDRHHYSTALSKVVNWRNFRRLVDKLSDKYLRGKRQEFGYIGRHVAVHLRMLRNSYHLRKRYLRLDSLGPLCRPTWR